VYITTGALGCTLDANGRDANIGQQQFHINDGATPAGDVPQVGNSIMVMR
jgi:hypothetical protein